MQKSCKYEVGLDVSEARSAIANELYGCVSFVWVLGPVWGLFGDYLGVI